MLVCLLFILIFGISTQYVIADDFDWPRWRGPNGDGISMETDWEPEALEGGPKILWKVNVGFGYSNVAIKDNRLYTMGLGGVYCFDADTGTEIWQHSLESTDDTLATPTTDGKYVCILEKEGFLSCLKAKNGTLLWEKYLVSEYDVVTPFYYFAASPVIDGDLLILTANTYGLALNKKTGMKIWGSEKPPESTIALFKETAQGDFETTGVDYSTPVLYEQEGKRYAILSSYEGMHAVDVETGEVLWLYEWDLYGGTGHKIDPLIFDNKVLIGGVTFNELDCGIVLLDISRKNPKVLWKSLNMYSNISSPVLVDGYIYGSHGGPGYPYNELRCLNPETGELMWKKELNNVPISLMAADGKLLILEADGTLRIAEATPTGYKEISGGDVLEGERTLRQFWTPPVLCNGKIYCRNFAGDVVCIDVSK